MQSAPAQTSLRKTLRPEWVFAMTLGSAIGWGAFILPFDWLESSGFGGVLIGFLLGGAMISIVGYCYGTVIRALPVTGGGVALALASLGRVHAFIAGWCLTLGYVGIVALNASAMALLFRTVAPSLMMQLPLYSVAGWQIYLPDVIVSSAFILAFALISLNGVEVSGRLQFFACILLLVSVGLLLAIGLFFGISQKRETLPLIPQGVAPLPAIGLIIAFAPWAYVGFDGVPQLAGEFGFSPRKAMGLLMWGIGSATLIYVAMTAVTCLAIGNSAESYRDATIPTFAAINEFIGPLGLVLLIVAVSMGVLTGLNGFFMASSRVLLTMARARMLPRFFAEVHAASGSPRPAIVAVTVICLVTPWFGRESLTWVVDMTSFGITVAYFYTCYCTWKLGRLGMIDGMQTRHSVSGLKRCLGIAGCVLAVLFMALLVIPGSPGALKTESMIALGIWILIGVGLFAVSAKKLLYAPRSEVESVIFSVKGNEGSESTDVP